MDDIDYAKYIIKKYIPFKNNGCRDKFIYRYNNSNDKDSRTNQLVNIIINLSKNNNTIIAEPVDKVIPKKETKDDKNKEISKLKSEIKKLKELNKLWENNYNQIGDKLEPLNDEIIELRKQVKDHKKYEDIKKDEINRLNKIIDTLPKQYKKLFKKPSNFGSSVLDYDYSSCSDDELSDDPENELNEGLN
jgi:chromosome segregation ATPase